MSLTRPLTRFIDGSIKRSIKRIDGTFRFFIDLQRSSPSSYLLNWTGTGAFEIELEYSTTETNLQYIFDSASGANRFFALIQIDGAMQINPGITNVFIDDIEIAPLDVGAVPKDGKLHKMKLVGNTTTEIGKIGLRFNNIDGFNGVIANVKITDLTTPSNSQSYALNEPTANSEKSIIGAYTITYTNILTADRFEYELQRNGNYLSIDELVANGVFATDTNWTKEAGWTIANGKALLDTTSFSTSIEQTLVGIIGLTYQTSYKVLDYIAGDVIITFNTGSDGITRNADGIYTEILLPATGTTLQLLNLTPTSEYSVDNISVKRVLEII